MSTPTWYLSRTFEIDSAGHRLSKHTSRCHNVHGHLYKVEFRIKRHDLNTKDMVMDFSHLKKLLSDLMDCWDHALILNSEDPNIVQFEQVSERIVFLENCDPTAEAMSQYFYHFLRKAFIVAGISSDVIKMDYVRVWETPSAYAEYRED